MADNDDKNETAIMANNNKDGKDDNNAQQEQAKQENEKNDDNSQHEQDKQENGESIVEASDNDDGAKARPRRLKRPVENHDNDKDDDKDENEEDSNGSDEAYSVAEDEDEDEDEEDFYEPERQTRRSKRRLVSRRDLRHGAKVNYREASTTGTTSSGDEEEEEEEEEQYSIASEEEEEEKEKKEKGTNGNQKNDKVHYELVGAAVCKKFEDGWYWGAVNRARQPRGGAAPLYFIQYNDGDSEEVELAELQELIDQAVERMTQGDSNEGAKADAGLEEDRETSGRGKRNKCF